MTIESRLRALEAARPEPMTIILVGFPDEDAPPLKPGWNPEFNVFQIVWPDHETDSTAISPDAA